MAIKLNKGPELGKYYYTKDNVVFGPIPLEELLKYIDSDTLVYYEGIEWTEAKNLPELKKFIYDVQSEELKKIRQEESKKIREEESKRIKEEESKKIQQSKEYDALFNKKSKKSFWPSVIVILLLALIAYAYLNNKNTNSYEGVSTAQVDTTSVIEDSTQPAPQITAFTMDDVYNNILSSSYIDEKKVNSLLFVELLDYRNELLARHGYIFDDQNVTDDFLKRGWYTPVNNYLIATSQFNEYEKSNFELIENQLIKINQTLTEFILQFYQSISDKTFVASKFFSDKVSQYISKKNITATEIDQEMQSYYNEFLNSKYSFSDPLEINILESGNSMNFISYKFHFEVERVSKQKLQSCDVTVRLGLNSQNKIIHYSEEKIENLVFSDIEKQNIDSLTNK